MSTRAVLVGLAEYLATSGVGVWEVDPATGYAPTDTAITIGALPAAPDAAIALTAYPLADDYSLSDSVIGVQVRTRTAGENPLDVEDLADAVFNFLHGLASVDLPTGAHVVSSARRSGVSLGTDQTGRWMRSDNYALTIHAPTRNRN
jgi:hypothetical protein